jgi:DNA-directed RNA polymerase specialized sigma24 family protein
MTERPPRCRPLPPSVVAAVVDTAPTTSRAELIHRLELALAALPADERTAVISSYAYAGGPIGAAVELDIDSEDADALGRKGLQLLRAALADLDPDD